MIEPQQNQRWRVSVQDTGRGIPEADQKRLFEPFFRASNVGITAGTGLGLRIIRQSIEFHKGNVGFVSKEGEGSTFFFELPGAVSHYE